MGIDPGRKRVGIAISDENKIIATPYSTLIKNKYSEFLKEIIKIFNENQIKGIVVGNPINMAGSSSQSSQSAKDIDINLSKDITNINDCITKYIMENYDLSWKSFKELFDITI